VAERRVHMTRLAWSWYATWTLVDYYTTASLYGIYHEVNPLITWLVSMGLSIDAALAVLGIAMTALIAAMYIFGGRILRLAAIGVMWVRAIAAVNNIVLIASGRSLIDYLIILNIPPLWAMVIVTLIPTVAVAIALARGRP